MAQSAQPIISTTVPTPPHHHHRSMSATTTNARFQESNGPNNNKIGIGSRTHQQIRGQPPPVYPRSARIPSRDGDDYYMPGVSMESPGRSSNIADRSGAREQASGSSESTFWQHQTPFDTISQGVPGHRVKKLDLSATADSKMLSVSPPTVTSTPSGPDETPTGVQLGNLHILTETQGSSGLSIVGFQLNDTRSPPSSVQTSSSYRSPTKWTNFEEDEESGDYSDGAESTSTGQASPSATRRFNRLDSHSSGPISVQGLGAGVGSITALSADLETKNLLDADAFSEADAQSLSEEDPYVMSDEQRIYYQENFKQLQRATQGSMDLGGAIRGADEKVINFFRKSNLGQDILWKIWQLADVNQDGWLNLDEFSVAMHLIVLFVKGNVPVPDYLPPHIAPPMTPPRCAESEMMEKGGNMPGWQNFEDNSNTGATEKFGPETKHPDSTSMVSTDDSTGGIQDSPQMSSKEFTSLPPPSGTERPVPVKISPDSEEQYLHPASHNTGFPQKPPNKHHQAGPVPTPPRRTRGLTDPDFVYPPGPQGNPAQAATLKKASTLPISPPGPGGPPKGPPPKPPPRPPHRGHGRSASLDLSKGGMGTKGVKLGKGGRENNFGVPGLSTENVSPPSLPPSATASLEGNNPPLSSRINTYQDNSEQSAIQQQQFATNSSFTGQKPQVSLPPLPLLPNNKQLNYNRNVETQTDLSSADWLAGKVESGDWPDAGITRNRLSGAPPIIDLGEEDDAEKGGRAQQREGPSGDSESTVPRLSLDWKGRCRKLERANEELEKERVRLAEQRLQLELQLQKLKERKLKQ